MEAIYLKSMTDFVIRKYKDELVHSGENWRDFLEKYARITKSYADFLKQPLQLGFFVPCDENGSVLRVPNEKLYQEFRLLYPLLSDWKSYKEEYQKAKEKVLFEGFEYIETENYFFVFNEEKLVRLQRSNFKTETVEFISGQEVELTPTAIKQIGL